SRRGASQAGPPRAVHPARGPRERSRCAGTHTRLGRGPGAGSARASRFLIAYKRRHTIVGERDQGQVSRRRDVGPGDEGLGRGNAPARARRRQQAAAVTRPLRFAIVGCGYITQAEHVPSFLTLLPDIEVVATADPDRARAEAVAAPFRARAYGD